MLATAAAAAATGAERGAVSALSRKGLLDSSQPSASSTASEDSHADVGAGDGAGAAETDQLASSSAQKSVLAGPGDAEEVCATETNAPLTLPLKDEEEAVAMVAGAMMVVVAVVVAVSAAAAETSSSFKMGGGEGRRRPRLIRRRGGGVDA